jgi:hypothetical protein
MSCSAPVSRAQYSQLVFSNGGMVLSHSQMVFFIFCQSGSVFLTYLSNYRWFIAASAPTNSSPSLSAVSSQLWHFCLGHLAVRTINCSIDHQCVWGPPNRCLNSFSQKCNSCLLSKSTHSPFVSQSCETVNKPGDVVAIDLVGPFMEALNGLLYGLVLLYDFHFWSEKESQCSTISHELDNGFLETHRSCGFVCKVRQCWWVHF